MSQRKGGVRKRLGIDTPDDSASAICEPSASSSDARRGGVRQRLGASRTDNLDKMDGPLLANLKARWGKGKLSAKDIESLATSATAQGANHLPEFSSPTYPQNLQRSLIAKFGKPKGAPDFSGHRFQLSWERCFILFFCLIIG